MAKNKLINFNTIWSILNVALSFYIWRKAVELEGGMITFDYNLPNYILGFVILNSILAFVATEEKQSIFGYLINSLTLYILLIIIIEIYWVNF